MTDPLSRFEAEHDAALAALARLESAATGLLAGNPPGPHFTTIREVHRLLTGAIREHNEAEERALFPFIEEAAPVGPFMDEHQVLWGLERELDAALEQRAVDRTARVGLAIVDLLRAHIQRENEVLFPMARAVLGPEGLTAVSRRLET